MTIRAVVTRGYGNGTYNGTITEAALRGFSIGAVAAPSFNGVIQDVEANENGPNVVTDFSGYFTGATSYSINPAVEAGWDFDTVTGILTVDTDEANTFGPYTVTGTNVSGSADSNAFNVVVSLAGGGKSKRKKEILGLPTYEQVAKKAKQKRDELREQAEKEREALQRITSSTKLKEKLREYKAKGLTKGLTEDRIEAIAKIDDDINRALAIEFALDQSLDFKRREAEALAILLMVA